MAKSTTLSAGDAKSMKELADAQAKLNKLMADEEIQKKKLQGEADLDTDLPSNREMMDIIKALLPSLSVTYSLICTR